MLFISCDSANAWFPSADSMALDHIGAFATEPMDPPCSLVSGGHSGLSQVTLLITLKSRPGDASIGWMLELLMHNVRVAVVDTECSAKESNCSVFLNPVHRQSLFECVNDMPLTRHCRSTVWSHSICWSAQWLIKMSDHVIDDQQFDFIKDVINKAVFVV